MYDKKMLLVTILLATVAATPAGADLQCTNENIAAPATTAHLVDNGDGTVSDPKTGLIWKKCPEGQAWNTGTKKCDGTVAHYTWKQALLRAAQVNAGAVGQNLSHADWRLPNIKELNSIVERRCWNPAINEAVFPATSDWFWSSSPIADHDGYAWTVVFYSGHDSWSPRNAADTPVRLVRSGQ